MRHADDNKVIPEVRKALLELLMGIGAAYLGTWGCEEGCWGVTVVVEQIQHSMLN